MLPEDAFREGPNRVELLSVTSTGGPVHLGLVARAG
jgi:hypothetical protein